MRRGKILLILAVCTMILSGCSMKFSAEENAVYVNKDGEIVSAIVESFDKDYYDAEELQDMLEQSVIEYNAENGKNSIKVDSFKLDNGVLKVIMNYLTWADYSNFNEVQFFAGQLSDIQGKNYGKNISFISRDGAETVAFEAIEGEYHVILVEEKIVVQTAGKIAYVSENVNVEGDKLARLKEDAAGIGYIIYKK